MVGLDKARHGLSSYSVETHPDTALMGWARPPPRLFCSLGSPSRPRLAPVTAVITGQRPTRGRGLEVV